MLTRLKKISNSFLQEPEDLGSIWQNCKDYKALLLELSDLDLQSDDLRDNITLEQGVAIGTAWAAYCLDDFIRTKRFYKGIYSSIQHLQSQERNRPVHLLYAGTGPFATLVLPLISSFSPDQLQLTLLEINPNSYQNLEKMIGQLNMEPYLRRLELADATKYQIPTGEAIDVLLSETMQAGLRREAQVPIFQNLLRQDEARDAILIPERIELFLGAYASNYPPNEQENHSTKLGSYFCLDRHHILKEERKAGASSSSKIYPFASFWISEALNENYDKMAIFTEIDIAHSQCLSMNESGLTIPLMIRDLHHDPASEQEIQIAYHLDDEPKEIIKFIN